MHDINQVREFITALTGSADSLVTFQVFYDPKKPHPQRPDLAAWWTNTLANSEDFIRSRQAEKCGVYMCVNETDGEGRKEHNVTRFRAFFADFDGQTEPQWVVQPHLVQKRDETHGHAFWLINDDDLTHDEWTQIQKRISMFYGTDNQVIDPCRVIRVPSTWHFKNPDDPKMYQITQNYANGHTYSVTEIVNAHVLDAQKDAEFNQWVANREGIDEGTGYEDHPFEVKSCARWFEHAAPPAVEGSGTHTLIRVASYAHDRGVSLEKCIELLWEHYNPRCEPPWGEHEKGHFREVVQRAYKYSTSAAGCKSFKAAFQAVDLKAPTGGWENYTLEKPMTEAERIREAPVQVNDAADLPDGRLDKGDALILSGQLNGKSSHYQLSQVFDGTRYNGEDIIASNGTFYRYGQGCWQQKDVHEIRTEVLRFYSQYNPSSQMITGVTNVLRDLINRGVVDNGMWLNDPNRDCSDYMVFENGIVNVGDETLSLLPHTNQYFTLNKLPHEFTPTAQCPEWLKFLESVWGDNQELKDQLQEWMGYTLVKDTRYQKMGVFIGKARAGKGTICDIISTMVGTENAMGVSLSDIIKDSTKDSIVQKQLVNINDAHSVNANISNEVLSTLKAMTGEDDISFHQMYVGSKSAKVTAKFMIQSNNMPEFTDPSGALVARMLVFPFTRSFVGKEDTGLKDRLHSEIEGITQWAIEGLKRLRRNRKFTEAADGKTEKESIRETMSPVSTFIKRRCIVDAEGTVVMQNLYNAYKQFMSDRNGREVRVFSYEKFTKFLKDSEYGFRIHSHEGQDILEGMKLNHGAVFNNATSVTAPPPPPNV